MSLRVIAGIAKGRRLKVVPGEGTRPVMDRVKESLFNIIRARVPESSFLDCFAGTGSVGIEALSRGAASARFVENARTAIQIIEENLAITGFTAQAEIKRQDVFDYLRTPQPDAFEIVYVAPPQYKDLWAQALTMLDANPLHITPDGLVIVQIDPTEKHDLPLKTLVPFDERRYGNTLLCFYERPGE